MGKIDTFASSLLEEAKRFLERAQDAKGAAGEVPNLHAALMLSFCALEAHVNAVADDFSGRKDLTPHEIGILTECDVALEDGEYIVLNRLRIFRLEDRIAFLHQKFSKKFDHHAKWRSNLAAAIDLRNKLTHPKAVPTVNVASVTRAIEAIIETIDALYRAVYRRKFPAVQSGLKSKLDF